MTSPPVTNFPANPQNGTVFEIRRGFYYIYEAATRSWIRVAGAGQLFPLATPVTHGLMAAADLRKINRILVPMPAATITGENCQGRFVAGHIGLYSTDDFLKITGEPLIHNASVGGTYAFRITKNTAGFDFTLDKQALIAELIERGQINLIGPVGLQGRRGRQGNPGGVLPTGPKGAKGDKGKSPPCSMTITADPAPAQVKDGINKAIVGLDTEQVSDTEFDLIVERGIVGNPDATPTSVNARCNDDSNWVLAMPTSAPGAQSLYYFDIDTIVGAIKDKFEAELLRLKRGHEEVVQFWLERMAALFYAQKAILCCALTQCKSLNASRPQPISGTVAISDVGGVVRTEEQTATTVAPFLGSFTPASHTVSQDDIMVIDGLINVGSPKAAARLELPAGTYVAEIVDCCIRSGTEFRGDIRLIYNLAGVPQDIQFVRPGHYTDERAAIAAYTGLTVELDHAGGDVAGYLASSLLHDSAGSVLIRFSQTDYLPAFSILHDINNGINETACLVTAQKLAEYEAAWIDGRCCGLVTRIAGQDYIIVKRSLRNDQSCGGGEDPSFDCLLKMQIIHGHPALAWPTIDGGKTFVKINRPAFVFKMDERLRSLAEHNLHNSLYVSPVGTGGPQHFTNIIFPTL